MNSVRNNFGKKKDVRFECRSFVRPQFISNSTVLRRDSFLDCAQCRCCEGGVIAVVEGWQ